MKRMCYDVVIGYEIKSADGEYEDYHVEHEYYDTYNEAVKAVERHCKGSVEGEYGDGAVAICDGAEFDEEPHEMEFF